MFDFDRSYKAAHGPDKRGEGIVSWLVFWLVPLLEKTELELLDFADSDIFSKAIEELLTLVLPVYRPSWVSNYKLDMLRIGLKHIAKRETILAAFQKKSSEPTCEAEGFCITKSG